MPADDDTCAVELTLENDIRLRCIYKADHPGEHGAPRTPTVDDTRLGFGVRVDVGMIYWQAQPNA